VKLLHSDATALAVVRLGDGAEETAPQFGAELVSRKRIPVDDRVIVSQNARPAAHPQHYVSGVDQEGAATGGAKSLPLILARELAANLATPMFLIDASGMLVFYNEAAEVLIGRTFGEMGEITANDFGEVLQLANPDGSPLRRRDTPAGVAYITRRPAHATLVATAFDGVRREVEVTAYPLFGTADEMHGVVTVFWETK
jgi:hypothetical protein